MEKPVRKWYDKWYIPRGKFTGEAGVLTMCTIRTIVWLHTPSVPGKDRAHFRSRKNHKNDVSNLVIGCFGTARLFWF